MAPEFLRSYRSKAPIAVFLLVTLGIALAFAIAGAVSRFQRGANDSARAEIRGVATAALPLRFEPVASLAGPARRYVAHGADYTIALDRGGVGIVLAPAGRIRSSCPRRALSIRNQRAHPEIIAMRLLGA